MDLFAVFAVVILASEHSIPLPVAGGVGAFTFGGLALYVIHRLWNTVDEQNKMIREMVGQLTLSTAVMSEVKELLR